MVEARDTNREVIKDGRTKRPILIGAMIAQVGGRTSHAATIVHDLGITAAIGSNNIEVVPEDKKATLTFNSAEGRTVEINGALPLEQRIISIDGRRGYIFVGRRPIRRETGNNTSTKTLSCAGLPLALFLPRPVLAILGILIGAIAFIKLLSILLERLRAPPTILVNGFGVIGSKIAGAARRCGFDVTVSEINPRRAKLAVDQGYGLYVSSKQNKKPYVEQDIEEKKVRAILEHFLSAALPVVLDATTEGVGAENKAKGLYKSNKVIYQGGEKEDIAQLTFIDSAPFRRISKLNSLRIGTCNDLGLARVLYPLLRKFKGLIIEDNIYKSQLKGFNSADEVQHYHGERLEQLLPKRLKSNLHSITTNCHYSSEVGAFHLHRITVTSEYNQRRITAQQIRKLLMAQARIVVLNLPAPYERIFCNDIDKVIGKNFDLLRFSGLVAVSVYQSSKDSVGIDMLIPYESNVVPENIDALNALTGRMGKRRSIRTTNRCLGLDKFKHRIEQSPKAGSAKSAPLDVKAGKEEIRVLRRSILNMLLNPKTKERIEPLLDIIQEQAADYINGKVKELLQNEEFVQKHKQRLSNLRLVSGILKENKISLKVKNEKGQVKKVTFNMAILLVDTRRRGFPRQTQGAKAPLSAINFIKLDKEGKYFGKPGYYFVIAIDDIYFEDLNYGVISQLLAHEVLEGARYCRSEKELSEIYEPLLNENKPSLDEDGNPEDISAYNEVIVQNNVKAKNTAYLEILAHDGSYKSLLKEEAGKAGEEPFELVPEGGEFKPAAEEEPLKLETEEGLTTEAAQEEPEKPEPKEAKAELEPESPSPKGL